MIGEEILTEIDVTLDRLIQNASAMRDVSLSALAEEEIEAFQKTQESLIAHLMHMDCQLQEATSAPRSSYKIQEKLLHFEELNLDFISNVAKQRRLVHFELVPQLNLKKRIASRKQRIS